VGKTRTEILKEQVLGEPQARNWFNTRKCALERQDWAIEDGITVW